MTASVSGSGGGGQPPDRGGRDRRKADLIKKATAKGKTKLASNIKKPRRAKPTPSAAPLRRSQRSNLGTRTVAAPILSANGGTAGLEGGCGFFTRTRTWYVANAVQGLIIQKVTRTFDVQRYVSPGVWLPMDAAAVNLYVQDPDSAVHADCVQYWELWSVRADGIIHHNGDSFSLGGVVLSDPLQCRRSRLRRRQCAGILPSRLTDPAGDLASAGIVASGAPVRYQVHVTWDSTATDTDSVVTVS